MPGDSKSPPRAWWKDRMWNVCQLQWNRQKSEWSWVHLEIDEPYECRYVLSERVKLLWPTSLLDKNGTEGYQKDVIAWTDWAPWDDQVPITKTGVIEWESGKFVVRCIETADVEDLCQIGDFTIRGNSLENPDLLNH